MSAEPACAWCPDYDRTVPAHRARPLTMCPACARRLAGQIATLEADRKAGDHLVRALERWLDPQTWK